MTLIAHVRACILYSKSEISKKGGKKKKKKEKKKTCLERSNSVKENRINVHTLLYTHIHVKVRRIL
jgi:hypothetical protein